jgi:hypothetical protein
MHLINPEISRLFATIPYAGGHGGDTMGIGGGIIYYALTCVMRARVCVCLGSGGGFVPCLMRQAQRDMGLDDPETYLVDAILPEAGFGGPEVEGGWRDSAGVFSKYFPEIVTLSCLTQEAAHGFFTKNRIRIDFLHVDADHSFEGVLSDFEAFLPLLNPSGFMTFHDTNADSVHRALRCIAERRPEFQCLDMPDFGAGLAILRRKPKPID